MSVMYVAKSRLSNLRVSPIKLNLVANLIRKKPIAKALDELQFTKKRIGKDVYKCLMSALSNAENNNGYDIDDLYISAVHVGKSLMMKRFKARARGRGAKIQKFFSNVTIYLHTKKEVNKE